MASKFLRSSTAPSGKKTKLAIQAGFRGIDIANQRKHYHEVAVGKAITAAIRDGLVTRDELFLQTKFTFQDGQDHRLSYVPKASVSKQVEQSCASFLDHLGVESIDSFVLHGPSERVGLTAADWEAWRAMEAIYESGRVKFLGVSNVNLEQLEALCEDASIQPRFVQNRCFAAHGWDRKVRTFCGSNEIVYQGFSLLTPNQGVLTHPDVIRIANRYARTPPQIVFRFAMDVGVLPLTRTTNRLHMKADLDVLDFELQPDEGSQIEELLGS